MAKQTFRIHGTSCKSCEIVIERQLREQTNVVSATASHNQHTLVIETKGDTRLSAKEVNEYLKPHHYTVSDAPQKAVAKPPVDWGRVATAAVGVFILYWILDRLGVLRLSPSASSPSSYASVLVIGLLASVSSCTAVVGGLVAGVSGAINKEWGDQSGFSRLRPHILFNIGRVVGFFVLGAMIGWLGQAFQLSIGLNGLLVVAVAGLMVVIGINLMEVFPAPFIGMPKWLAHKVHDLAGSEDPKAPLALGAMTFFLPCGFTQSMQLFALTLQNPWQSGMVMAVFALGTAPVLLGIGGATSCATGRTLKRITKAAGAFVLVLGLSNITNGLTLLGVSMPSFGGSALAEGAGTSTVERAAGVQRIAMEVTPWGVYQPQVLSVQQGTPVEWNITGADFMGCADSLILREFKVNTRLRPGKNVVKFTPTRAGRFTFSCSMGMVRGTMIVTPTT